MKLKWLLLLALVFVTACGPSESDDKKKEGEKKEEDKTTKVEKSNDGDKKVAEKTEEKKEMSSKNPAADLLAEYDAAFKTFMEKAQSATRAERAEVMKLRPNPTDYVDRFQAFAKDNPGTPIAATAYSWIAANVPDSAEDAIATLMDKHMDSPVMKNVAGALIGGKPSQQVEDRLNQLIENSPHDEVKGAATFQLVQYFDRNKSMASMVEELAKNPQAVAHFGEEGIEYLKNFKVDDAKVKGLYESIVENYSDVVVSNFGRETNIGESANAALFELNNLVVGCIAPDIEGKDIDGESFKLSDYRGKVVMLDFWGDW